MNSALSRIGRGFQSRVQLPATLAAKDHAALERTVCSNAISRGHEVSPSNRAAKSDVPATLLQTKVMRRKSLDRSKVDRSLW